MIDHILSYDDFSAGVSKELADLLASAKAEYQPRLIELSGLFSEQVYKLLNATTDADRKRAESNICHIQSGLTHISAQLGLDVTERLIAICSAVLTIAAAAAIRAVIPIP